MIKTYSGTQYILRNPNGNGELIDRYETFEAAKEGRIAAMEREREYRKNNGYSCLTPSKYAIVQSTWSRVVDIDAEDNYRFISYTLNEFVVSEE